MGSYCLTENRVSILKNEKIPEVDKVDGCTTLAMNLMPLTCTCKTGQNGKFYLMYSLP